MIQTRTARRNQRLLVALVTAATFVAAFVGVPRAEAAFSDYDFASAAASTSTSQAGAHADFVTEFQFTGDAGVTDSSGQAFPHALMREVSVEMPPGMVGNPDAFPTCTMATFLGAGEAMSGVSVPQCPVDSQVGIVSPGIYNFFPAGFLPEALYNLESPGGDVVARLGFYALLYPVVIDIEVDASRDNALTATIRNAPTGVATTGAITTIWGVPTDASHDGLRMSSVTDTMFCGGACAPTKSGLAPTAYMTNPTSCEAADVVFGSRSYANSFATPQTAALGSFTGCEAIPFEPVTELTPTTPRADAPSGIDVRFSIDQSNITDPNGLAQSHLKRAVVTLPEGMSLNPSAADGLGSCSEDQIGLTSKSPIRFDAEDPTCPNASNVGTAKIKTPVLEDPLEGNLYVAEQDDNPFDSLLAGYMVAKGKGVIIKLAGNFERDQDTGQITATFDNNPQQPFSDLELHFKGGSRGVLATPATCGSYEIQTELTPWSGGDPVTQTSSFTIDQGPDGGPCLAGDATQPGDPSDLADRPFEPQMSAGVQNPTAGGYSPFVFQLERPSGHQEILSTTLTPPQGLTAKLAGVPLCTNQQANAGNCPASSQIGEVIAGAGAGPTPFYIQGADAGKVFMTDAYKGEQLGMLIQVPAKAGPFDLGTVNVRAAVAVDKRTAQLTVKSDPIPQILEGIPLRTRDIRIKIDRPDFTIAPTNCDPMEVKATATGSHGATASLQNRFQVGDCGSLGFSPNLDLSFGNAKKNTKANAHPPLNAKLSFNEGDSNISSVEVALPQGLFLDQDRLGRICSRANYAAETCPEESVVGYAKATTPLLDDPVEGPVYLKASDNPLPDLAADLNGQIDVDLFGKIDQKTNKKGLNQIRNTFDIVPDVPVSDFELKLDGGSDGLLVNSRNICKSKKAQKVSIDMVAHNEMTLSEKPLVGSACKQINKKRAKKLKAKARKLLAKAKKADNNRKAKKLRKQARKLKRQARKLGR